MEKDKSEAKSDEKQRLPPAYTEALLRSKLVTESIAKWRCFRSPWRTDGGMLLR